MKKIIITANFLLTTFLVEAQQQFSLFNSKNLAIQPKRNVLLSDLQSQKSIILNNNLNKGTAGGGRWYNYVDLMSLIDPNVSNNAHYTWLWHKFDMMSMYGTTLDTVFVRSYGTSLDPSTTLFNSTALYPGTIAFKSTDAYSVDSVIIYGNYDRKVGSTTTDTLKVSFVYGVGSTTNMPVYYFSGQTANFGKDTVRFGEILLDSLKQGAAKNASSTANVITVNKLLTAANVNDTLTNGLNYFKVAVPNFNIPANGVVGVTVSYKYGGTYTPFSTLYSGTAYNFNAFTGLWYEQNANGLPTYVDGDYNTGFLSPMPMPSTSSWYGYYIPTWAYTAAYSLEFPYVDVHVVCSTCSNTTINEVKSSISLVNASPNPATDKLNISFLSSQQSTAKVSILNLMGQEIESKTINTIPNTKNELKFNTSNLNSGIYLYNISTEDQTTSNRFVITH